MIKVIILGGGISGLSCAHELARNKKFKIEIYEKNDVLGGQSRSFKHGRCYTEYCWRVWTQYYYNFYGLCEEIPTENGTVMDNFTPIDQVIISNERKTKQNNVLGLDSLKYYVSSKEYNRLIEKFLSILILSNERMKTMNISLFEYLDPQEQGSVDFIDAFIAPILGLEPRRATLYTTSRAWQSHFFQKSLYTMLFGTKYPTNNVTKKPYNEAIFKPWGEYLERNGVIINYNNTIRSIIYDPKINMIDSLIVEKNNKIKYIKGDMYVICLDQSGANKIIQNSAYLRNMKPFSNLELLCRYCNQYYFAFDIYFTEQINNPEKIYLTIDQPWKAMIKRTNKYWNNNFVKNCETMEVWNVAMFDLVKGTKYNKILRECSLEEAIDESFHQLKNSKLLSELKTESGRSIWDAYDGYQVWPGWFNDENKKLNSDEFKFSVNKDGYQFMPNTKTPISNLLFGSVFTESDNRTVSMEVACTNGKKAAYEITKKYNQKLPYIYVHKNYLHYELLPIRFIDKILFKFGLSSITSYCNSYVVMTVYACIIILIIICSIINRNKIKKFLKLKII